MRRGAAVSATGVAVGVLLHAAAGGSLPGGPVLVLVVACGALLGAALLPRRTGGARLAAAVGAVQVLLHQVLAVPAPGATPSPGHAHDATAHAVTAGGTGGHGTAMVLAHVGAALLELALWRLAARARTGLLTALAERLAVAAAALTAAPIPGGARQRPVEAPAAHPRSAPLRSGTRRRGPPRAAARTVPSC